MYTSIYSYIVPYVKKLETPQKLTSRTMDELCLNDTIEYYAAVKMNEP